VNKQNCQYAGFPNRLLHYQITSPATAECKPILCSSYDSDTSWRVRIASAWKGVDYKVRYVNMADSEHVSRVGIYKADDVCRILRKKRYSYVKIMQKSTPAENYQASSLKPEKC
jgi:hypothetical protein